MCPTGGSSVRGPGHSWGEGRQDYWGCCLDSLGHVGVLTWILVLSQRFPGDHVHGGRYNSSVVKC